MSRAGLEQASSSFCVFSTTEMVTTKQVGQAIQEKLTFLKQEKTVSLCKGLYSLQHLTVNQIGVSMLLDKIRSLFLVNSSTNNLMPFVNYNMGLRQTN